MLTTKRLSRHRLVCVVLCTALLLIRSHVRPQAEPSPQQAIFSPDLSGGQMIKSLQCFADNALFAVGGRNDQGPPARLLAFDGTQWRETVIASLGGFNGVWGSSPQHVFAVGGQPGEIWHYNGEGWNKQYRGNASDNLHGVWGCASNDVWAVGQDTSGGGGIALHYDGTSWTRLVNFGHGLLRIWGSACHDIWVTGALPPSTTEFWHYDGTSWTRHPASGIPTGIPGGLWGSSSGQLWSVHSGGEIFHWDGSTWAPQPSGTTTHLATVFGFASDDVFVAGASGTLHHYDGRAWHQVSNNAGSRAHFNTLCGLNRNQLIAGGLFHPGSQVGSEGFIQRIRLASTPTASCNGIPATLVGTPNNDTLTGTAGPDVIVGLEGDDSLHGKGGDDVICGGDGDDVITGGNGNDELWGGNGNDSIKGGAGRDILRGDQGADGLSGGSGDDELLGGVGDDELRGNAGDDLLRGNAGDDLLRGDGDDELRGGNGDDALKGGVGSQDLCRGGAGDNDTVNGCETVYGVP